MELKEYRLGDVAKVVNGSTPSTSHPEYYDGDIIWITPKDLSEQKTKYIQRGEHNISLSGYNSCSTQMIPANNLLLTSRAPIGLLAINTVDCCTNQGFKNIIVDKEIVNVDYLFYYIKVHIAEIESLGAGTTFKEVSKNSLEQYKITIPSLSTQRKIAGLLSALDAKISLCREMNRELEGLARQIYQYWFLQFQYPNATPLRTYNPILKHNIPDGWHCGNLFEIANFTNGLACQNHRPAEGEKGIPVIKIKEMHDGFSNDTEFVSENIPESVKVHNGDILFSWSASLEVMMWANGEGGLNQHIFKVTPKEGYTKIYCYFQLLYYIDVFKKIADARKTTMGHITQDHLQQSTIAIPDDLSIIKDFEAKVAPMFDSIVNNQTEISALTHQRDALLPLLMNGQVVVD